VQGLLKKVTVRPVKVLSRRFLEEMPCRLIVRLKDGRELIKEEQDCEGFHGRPMQWETVAQKFHHLSGLYTDAPLWSAILEVVINLERISVAELTQLLSQVKTE
jgi:2-methylcitrate dehydratase